MGQGAAASHETAAHLHQLPTVTSRTSVVWLTRPPTSGHGRHRQPGIIERAAALPPWQVVTLAGLRTTSVARTVVDLGRHLPFREAVVVADAALRQGFATAEELLAVRDSCSWWPGIEDAGKVLAFADGRAESALESVSRVMFAEQGLPPAILQATIQTRDGTFYRADFLWKEQRVIGEADGRLKYETREDLWREKLREDRLRDAGFEIVRWVWDEAMYREEQVAERIRRAAARQSRPF
jgi:very-short-patch-repair endonuclease